MKAVEVAMALKVLEEAVTWARYAMHATLRGSALTVTPTGLCMS